MLAKEKGKWAEELATFYLEKSNYSIIDKNFVYENNEVDIIATQENLLVFIEVKMRNCLSYGYPEKSMNKRQKDGYKKIAVYFLDYYKIDREIRFDLLAISMPKTLFHFKDAFY